MVFGWLFDTLSYRVDQKLRIWNRTNPERRRLAYGQIQEFLTWASEHVFRFLVAVFLLATTVSVALGWAVTEYTHVAVLSDDWTKPHSELSNLFNVVWGIQTTITALVYPIVLAFVAVLLSQRASAKISLRLYMIDAAALPAGLSAITLVSVMGVLKLFTLISGTGSLAAFLYGVLFWFILNAFLTGWFLYRTLLFLHDDHRLRVFEQYAARIAFPREARQLIEWQLFINAQSEGLLPGKEELSFDEPENSSVALSTQPANWGEGDTAVMVPLDRSRIAVDIRYRLLRIAVSRWLKAANRKVETQDLATRRLSRPLMVLPLPSGFLVEEQEAVLCRTRYGPKFDALSQALIRLAYVFGDQPPPGASHTTTETLTELAADVIAHTRSGSNESFREARRALRELHLSLLKAGQYEDENGQRGNIVCLRDPFGWSYEPMHKKWREVYDGVLIAAVDALPTNSVPFEYASDLARGLVKHLGDMPLEISLALLGMSADLMGHTGQWWSRKVEENGALTHDASNAAQLSPPLSGIYERALRRFIGNWEQTDFREQEIAGKPDETAWDLTRQKFLLWKRFLRLTAQMLLEAVARGDIEAAVWLTDSFLYWWARHRDEGRMRTGGIHFSASPFRTVTLFARSWSEISAEIDTNDNDAEAHADIIEYLAIQVFDGYWTDIRLLLILVLLEWSKTGQLDEPAMQIATVLLTGEAPKDRQERSVAPLSSPDQIIVPFLRQRFAEEKYTKELEVFVGQASQMRGRELVPWRIYGLGVLRSLDALNGAQLLVLAALASDTGDSRIDPGDRLEAEASRLGGLVIAREVARRLRDELSSEKFRERSAQVGTIRQELKLSGNPEAAELWVSRFIDWLDRLPEVDRDGAANIAPPEK